MVFIPRCGNVGTSQFDENIKEKFGLEKASEFCSVMKEFLRSRANIEIGYGEIQKRKQY